MNHGTVLLIALGGFFGACGGVSPEQQAKMDKEAANKAAYEKFGAAWDAQDKAAVGEMLADDFMTHNPDPMIPSTGKQHLLDQMDTYFAMSSDMKGTSKLLLADGDWVTAVVMVKGTNDGAMGDMPATGKPWEATAIDVMRFENGKIAEHWGLFDAMTMMGQLGLMGGDGHEDGMAMDKEHVCTTACKDGNHMYAHGEKGHVCTEECKKMMEKG